MLRTSPRAKRIQQAWLTPTHRTEGHVMVGPQSVARGGIQGEEYKARFVAGEEFTGVGQPSMV